METPLKLCSIAKQVSPDCWWWVLVHVTLCVYTAVCEKATKLCEKYARTKGPGSIARPERHPFFQKLAPMVKLHLDKSTRENGFM